MERFNYRGTIYNIYDAMPTKDMANDAAKDLRTLGGRVHPNNYTKVAVRDFGKESGRLRYGIFIAKGRKI